MNKNILDNSVTSVLKFNNGKLRIMHITDTHLAVDNIKMSLELISQAIKSEKPDVIIVTGDNVSGKYKEEVVNLTRQMMDCIQNYNVPVAFTFGNHDSENGFITRQELMDIYNEYQCSICAVDGFDCGTYNIPVFSDGKMKFNLWIIDSGDYDANGDYANVTEDKISWFNEKNSAIQAEHGKVYSFVFQHIIVPEVYNALKKVKFQTPYTYKGIYNHDSYYRFDPKRKNYGKLREMPCCGAINHGQFDSLVESESCLAVFSGHDHTNAFGVKYKGVDIVNSLSTRYQNDNFSTQYGYRIIDVDLNNVSKYTSKVVHWYDLYKVHTYKKYKDEEVAVAAKSVAFKSLRERFLHFTGYWIVRIFGLRKIRYED